MKEIKKKKKKKITKLFKNLDSLIYYIFPSCFILSHFKLTKKSLSTYRCFLGLSCEIGRGAQGSINVIEINVGNILRHCFTSCNALMRLSGGIG